MVKLRKKVAKRLVKDVADVFDIVGNGIRFGYVSKQ